MMDARREAQLLETIEQQRRQIAALQGKIDALIKRLFGAKSERLDPAQLLLLLQGLDDADAAKKPAAADADALCGSEADALKHSGAPKRKRAPRDEPRVPDHLPVIDEIIDPAEVKAAPDAWRCIGEEVTEQLDYEPAHFLKRRIIRKKYVRREDRFTAPVIAKLNTLQDRSIAAPGLLAAIIVGKYCDHLPLYRQEQIYATRHGVNLPRQTMARWMGMVAHDWLALIYQHIKSDVTGEGYVQVDETPVKYLEPGHGKARQGYLWTCKQPGGEALYHWETSRGAACLDNIIPIDFHGTLQSDAYSAYPAFAHSSTRVRSITLAGCLAHARRKFVEALESAGSRQAAWLLGQMRHLYRIEAELRNRSASAKERLRVRSVESRPIMRRIKRALIALKTAERAPLPQSQLMRAIDYTLGQWDALSVFLSDGRVEIDNNLVENAIRPTVLGKKNWLFFGEAQAGQRGAILYTLIESCRHHRIDPFEYLRDVLTRLPYMTNQQSAQLTPAAWAAAKRPMPWEWRLAS